jgi:hypothetical protein
MFVPTPLPDETIHSMVTRFHLRSGHPSTRDTKFQLFQADIALVVGAFPSKLAKLAAVFHPEESQYLSDLIFKHTNLPYFAPFITDAMLSSAVSAMKGNGRPRIKPALGFYQGGVPEPRWLRYCPDCLFAQQTSEGHGYWQRVHQLPGVTVCPEHQCQLIESNISSIGGPVVAQDFMLPEAAGTRNLAVVALGKSANLTARLSHELVHAGLTSIHPSTRMWIYKTRLAEIGYGSFHDLNHEAIRADLEKFWGNNYLQSLGMHPTENVRWSWLRKVYQQPVANAHPVKHLLLIGMLFNSIGDYAEYCKSWGKAKMQAAVIPRQLIKPSSWLELLPQMYEQNGGNITAIANALKVSTQTIHVLLACANRMRNTERCDDHDDEVALDNEHRALQN